MSFGTNVHSKASGHTGGSPRPTVAVTRVATVPDGAAVRDFDQLSPQAMDEFPALVLAGRTDVSSGTARELADGEIIKFTDYFRVEKAE